MSRIGKLIIQVPDQTTIEISGNLVKAHGPQGELSLELPGKLSANVTDNVLQVSRKTNDKEARSLHGLYRVLLKNIVTGVSEGFKKSLEFKGIGYRVAVAENVVTISAGYSHPVELTVPEGLTVTTVKNTVTVSGIDKYQVGEFAAKVRGVRPPEVYKGKGFRYAGEHIRLKPGKTAAKG